MKFYNIILQMKHMVAVVSMLLISNFPAHLSASEIQMQMPSATPFFQNAQSQNGLANPDDIFGLSETNSSFDYSPFSSYSAALNSGALKGPVGPPIGGLPISDCYPFILLLAVVYGVFRRMFRKFFIPLYSCSQSVCRCLKKERKVRTTQGAKLPNG